MMEVPHLNLTYMFWKLVSDIENCRGTYLLDLTGAELATSLPDTINFAEGKPLKYVVDRTKGK